MPHESPVDPSFAVVQHVNAQLGDPDFRGRIREMHAANTPLADMVQQLGLNPTPKVMEILDTLDADVVQGIRDATVAMLDGDFYVMPLDCMITKADLVSLPPADVHVKLRHRDGNAYIHVRRAQPTS